MNSSKDTVEHCRRLEERLRILSEAMTAFAEATPDSQRLLEAVARRVAEVIKDYCVVLLVSDDGQTLRPVAMFDPDPEALRKINDAFLEPFDLTKHPVSRRVLETGESFFAPKLVLERSRSSSTTPRYFDFSQGVGMHSILVVALRAHDRPIGVLMLARFRPDSPSFDEHDLDLAQNLASHAALAISNARLLVETQHERVEGRRIADRARSLAKAAHEFSSATHDLDLLLGIVARRLGELVGDMCVIRTISDDGEWLEPTGAAYHRDPELVATAREVIASVGQRVGEGISGTVAATGQPLLTPKLNIPDVAAKSEPRFQSNFERLGMTNMLTLPFLCRGKVVGVANLARVRTSSPYTEDDLQFAQSIADHAALAIGNARAYAAERTARDVAEKATIALREAQAMFARLSESGIVGIIVTDLGGRVIEVNDALLTMVGYSRDEILSGRVAWADLTQPEWRELDARAIGQLKGSGIAGLREKEYVRKDGSRVPVLVGSAMLEGTAMEAISFVLDLTERKQAQAAIARLREQGADDARFRAMLESAPDAMIIVAQGGTISLVNGQVETLFGYTRTELVGQPLAVLVPEPFRAGHLSLCASYWGDPDLRPMTAPLDTGRRKDGTEFPAEVRLSSLQTANGLFVCSSIRDVTDRKKAEQQRADLAAIVESSDDAIVGKTLDGTITSWNEGAHRMFGYTADEITGRPVSLIVPPGYEDEERMILVDVANGEVKRFDTVRQRKDGSAIDVSVTISPVRDAADRVVGISKVARDISMRKRSDEALASAKEAAEAATRELEAFSYSVAHDLRSPLRGMNGFAQVLLEDYGDKLDLDGRDCLQEIHSNAQKMGSLIDALLSLSRVTRSALKTETVDLSELFRAIGAQCAAGGPERKLDLVVQEHLTAAVDLNLTRALLENLVGNAWKFTAHAPIARIEFGATERDGTTEFFIKDNGAGFDMAYASKLFSPFQRLHTVAEFPGTGIGLATAQRIVRRHGGRIWAEGRVDEGAVFHFSLSGASRGIA